MHKFQSVVSLGAALLLAAAPAWAANDANHFQIPTLQRFQCIPPGGMGSSKFVNFHHRWTLQTFVGLPVATETDAGAVIFGGGATFTGLQMDIDNSCIDDFNPEFDWHGKDQSGNCLRAFAFCGLPTTQHVLPDGFVRKYWAPSAFGLPPGATIDTLSMYAFSQPGAGNNTNRFTNIQLNGHPVHLLLDGFADCSVAFPGKCP